MQALVPVELQLAVVTAETPPTPEASLAAVIVALAISAATIDKSAISDDPTAPVAMSAAVIVSAAISVVVTTPAAIAVVVVPAVIVTSPVSAGIRAAGMVPELRLAALRDVKEAPDPENPVAVTVPATSSAVAADVF